MIREPFENDLLIVEFRYCKDIIEDINLNITLNPRPKLKGSWMNERYII